MQKNDKIKVVQRWLKPAKSLHEIEDLIYNFSPCMKPWWIFVNKWEGTDGCLKAGGLILVQIIQINSILKIYQNNFIVLPSLLYTI